MSGERGSGSGGNVSASANVNLDLGGAVASRPSALSVRALLADHGLGMELALLAGTTGLDRQILHTRIQKSGLALAGHFHGIVPTRPQILGQTELSFLARLSVDDRRRALRGYFSLNLCCVIITQGKRSFEEGASGMGALPVPELPECADETGTPLLLSPERSSFTITALHALLDDRLAPRIRLHGVLVDVFGVGLLLMGSSGIGKSECALDLVMRGHRLVADDVVNCDYRPPGMVFGAPADLLRHHLEVRGLGILNIKDLYGVTAIRERKRIDVVVKLVEWSKDTEYDRLGIEDRYQVILGTKIRELVVPVRPGRDMASILEVAARNELLRNAGHHAAREFFENLEGALLSERARDESAAPPPVKPASSPVLPGMPRSITPRYVTQPPESAASPPRPGAHHAPPVPPRPSTTRRSE
jgi:HPr kinase/phosphorylase